MDNVKQKYGIVAFCKVIVFMINMLTNVLIFTCICWISRYTEQTRVTTLWYRKKEIYSIGWCVTFFDQQHCLSSTISRSIWRIKGTSGFKDGILSFVIIIIFLSLKAMCFKHVLLSNWSAYLPAWETGVYSANQRVNAL